MKRTIVFGLLVFSFFFYDAYGSEGQKNTQNSLIQSVFFNICRINDVRRVEDYLNLHGPQGSKVSLDRPSILDPNEESNGLTPFGIAYCKAHDPQADDTVFALLKRTYPDKYEEWHTHFNYVAFYTALPDAIVPDIPFNRCSQIIIDAAGKNEDNTVKKYMTNNYEERIAALRKIGLPNSYRSGEHILSLCKGEGIAIDDFTKIVDNDFLVDIIINSSDPNIKDENENALMHVLVENIQGLHNDRLQRLLANPHIDPNVHGIYGDTPFHVLCNKKWSDKACKEYLSLLLANDKVDPHCFNGFGNTALHEACLKGNVQAVKLLHDSGKVDFTIKSRSGNTPLHFACEGGNDKMVALLCSYPEVDPNIKNNDGKTAFATIVKNRFAHTGEQQEKIIASFLSSYPNLLNECDYEVLIDLFMKRDVSFIKGLLENRVIDLRYLNCNKKGSFGDTIMHKLFVLHCCRQEVKEIIDILCDYSQTGCLAEKIDFNRENEQKNTLLHLACLQGSCDLTQLLLNQSDIRTDGRNNYGNALLHCACTSGNYALLKLLTEQTKIDPKTRNNYGDTVFDIAYRQTDDLEADDTLFALLKTTYPVSYRLWHNALLQRKALPSLSEVNETKEWYPLQGVLNAPELLSTILSTVGVTAADMINLKRSSTYLNNVINYATAPDSIIQSLSFDHCSDLIITAAGKDDTATIKRLMQNNVKKNGATRMESLKILGLPEEYSDDDLLSICKGEVVSSERLNWKSLTDHAQRHIFALQIMNHSKDPNVLDCNGTTLLHQLAQTSLYWQDSPLEQLLKNPFIQPNIQNKQGNSALHLVFEKYSNGYNVYRDGSSNEKDIMALLAHKDVDPNIRDKNNSTILHKAYSKNYRRLAEQLCNHEKIDINATSSLGNTTLHDACRQGHLGIIKILCNNPKLKPSLKNYFGKTAFYEACFYKLYTPFSELNHVIEMIDIFFSQFPNLLNEWGYETFLEVCSDKKVWLVKKLLDSSPVRVDLSKKKNKKTILHELCTCVPTEEMKEIIKMLGMYSAENPAEKRIPYDAQDNCGNTFLHILCEKDPKYEETKKCNDDLVEKLINSTSIDINAKNKAGETALLCAFKSKQYDIVKLLLQCSKIHLSINAQNNLGHTALHIACENGDHEIIHLLLTQKGIDVNCQGVNNRTPLHIACEKNDMKTAALLLQKESLKFDLEDIYKYTAFNRACANNGQTIVGMFLKNKRFDINVRGQSSRDTGLNETCRNGHIMLVGKLLVAEQKHDQESVEKSFLELFSKKLDDDSLEIIKLLFIAPQVDFDQQFYVKNVLFPAIKKKNITLITVLLQSKKIYNLNSHTTESGQTVLHKICKALRCGNTGETILTEEIIKLVLAKNIDLNAQDTNNLTALDLLHKWHIHDTLYISPEYRTIYNLLIQNGAKHSWQYCIDRFKYGINKLLPADGLTGIARASLACLLLFVFQQILFNKIVTL